MVWSQDGLATSPDTDLSSSQWTTPRGVVQLLVWQPIAPGGWVVLCNAGGGGGHVDLVDPVPIMLRHFAEPLVRLAAVCSRTLAWHCGPRRPCTHIPARNSPGIGVCWRLLGSHRQCFSRV